MRHEYSFLYIQHLMTHIYGHIRRHLPRSTSIFTPISTNTFLILLTFISTSISTIISTDTFRKTPPFSPPYPPSPFVRHSHTYLHHRHHLPYDTFIIPPFSLRFLASPPNVNPSQKQIKTYTNSNIKKSLTLLFFCKVLSFFYIL